MSEPNAAATPPLLVNVTAANSSKALRAAGARGTFLGFTAASCMYCSLHEAEWREYAALAAESTALPHMMRVDADLEEMMVRRHEVMQLPALVLSWSGRWTRYEGPHTSSAMAAFGAAQIAPLVQALSGMRELEQLLDGQKPSGRKDASVEVGSSRKTKKSKNRRKGREDDAAAPRPLLLLGFFHDATGDESEELEDFTTAARELRRLRTDVAVRAAYLEMTPDVEAKYVRSLHWIVGAPSAVLLRGGEPAASVWGGDGGGIAASAYRLDEQGESTITLGEWAARAAVPLLGELTPLTFAAYAATNLPMLIAFVAPNATNPRAAGRLPTLLRSIGKRYRGRVTVALCDAEAQGTQMLALGLDPTAALPQFGINTKETGRRIPFPRAEVATEKALSRFVDAYLGDRLEPPSPPPLVPSSHPEKPSKGGKGRGEPEAVERGGTGRPPPNGDDPSDDGTPAGGKSATGVDRVRTLMPATFDRVALDVTSDVLLLLHAAEGCEACAQLRPYIERVAERAAALSLTSLVVAQYDVRRHGVPSALRAVASQMMDLPTILMLPARRKDPPFSLYHGEARPKELLYFAQRHASLRFELPPNPHLTREQHAAWKAQVGDLPKDKMDNAYRKLKQETGLDKDEV